MTEEERMEWLKKEVKKSMPQKPTVENPKPRAKILKFKKRKKNPKKEEVII
jgi:hypothetical protein